MVVIPGPAQPGAAPLLPVPPPRRPSILELGTIEPSRWVEIDPTAMPTAFAAFDPVAAAAWFLSGARAWSADARFERITLDGVKPDGLLDLTSRVDWAAEYRFYSPALRESAIAAAAVSEREILTELRVKASRGKVEAFLDGPGSMLTSPAEFAPACPASRVLELLRGHGLSPLPTYELTMSCTSGPCAWRADPPHGAAALASWNADLPEIPAGDCSSFR
jgi:hypothetical protein